MLLRLLDTPQGGVAGDKGGNCWGGGDNTASSP